MCNFPSADFALSYGGLPALTQGQLYTIVVDFAIPDSPFNQASGMSLLTVELFDADGNRTMLFRKSFSVPYRSNLLRLANRLILLPLYLTGVIGEEMQLSVPLSADFQDLQHQPSTRGRVTLESRDLTWCTVFIRFKAVLNGFSKLLYHWPWTTFVALTLFSFCVINCIYLILLTCHTALPLFQTVPDRPLSFDLPKQNSQQETLAPVESVASREKPPLDRSINEVTDVANSPR